MAELKPCPSCGNKKIVVIVDNAEYSLGLSDEASFEVICSTTSGGCGASSGWCNTKQKAIEKWNTRANKKGGNE